MTAKLFYLPMPVAFTSNGLPAAGAKLHFYASGSSTPAPIYTTSALNVEHPNPVPANGAGRFPSIYLDSSVTYRLVIVDKNDVELDDVDPYTPGTFFGPPGINGGTASNLTIGLFVGAAGQDLTAGGTKPAPEVVFTSGFRQVGKGAACYFRDAAVDAAFVAAHPGWSFRDSQGNGYRLSEDQRITFEMFGAYGDSDRSSGGGTDDYPQWLIAKDFLQTNKRTHGNAYYKSVPALYLGRYDYRFSHYLDLTEGAYSFYGAGPNALGEGGNTAFVFDAGQCGIICQSWDTTGVSSTTTNTAKGSAYSYFADIDCFSRGGTIGAAQHGWLIKSPVVLERCGAYQFGGHGFLVAADVTYAGNANCGKLIFCKAWQNCLDGLNFVGGDSNAWEIIGFNAIYNGRWGIYEISFLGNNYYGYHTASNGAPYSGSDWAPTRYASVVYQSGHYYLAIPGVSSAALAANAPTGTTASNAWWNYYGDGAPTSAFVQWVSGGNYREGGAFYLGGASNRSSVHGGYMESDQGAGWVDANRILTINGFSGFGGPGAGAQISAWDGRVVMPSIGTTVTSGDGPEIRTDRVGLSNNCYFIRLDTEAFQLRGPLDISVSMARNNGSAQRPYSMAFPNGLASGACFIGSGSAAPTSGTWARGDRINNDGSVTALGTTDHWVCSVAGTPGTWIAKA